MRNIFDKAEEGLISLLLVSMTFLVFLEVVMRFGFNAGFLWIQELTLLVSGWFVLLGASYGVRVGAHIGVDVFVKKFPPNTRRLISIAAVLMCMFYCALLFIGSWEYLAKIYKINLELEDMEFPKWVAHSILVIGFGLLFIRFGELLWKMIIGKEDGFHLADEAKEALEEIGIKNEEEAGK
ncbi:TRAP transporter small permease [Sneathiella sp. P13V-1]|uniref:TRAP transporter small permease n=1 Tax=Sneathiella sp. P13V-1 TaxID=2697366 RepID=UPI001D0F6DCB|nr:TRAP transporter small permease [Sneathiella sp. P13V-1]